MYRQRGRMCSNAFTLTEVIVVTGILLILAALLIPVGYNVLESSRSTRCQANLRSIGAALHLFAVDNRGYIPMRRDNRRETGERSWAQILTVDGYLPESEPGVSPIRYCPSEIPVNPTDFRTPNRPTHENYSYGMRRWAEPGKHVTDTDADSRLYSLSSIEEPASFFLITDSYFTQHQSQGYFVDATGGNSFWRVHLRHGNRANTLFADGRVEAMERDYFENLHETQNEYNTRGPFPIWPDE